MKSVLSISILLFGVSLFSQVGIGTTEPSAAAMLEISSQTNGTGDYKGLMPPRVPDIGARNAINPSLDDEGLLAYVLSEHTLYIWTGTEWQTVHKNSSGGYASDLFISEYVEGSSNNKAIEIANFTGSSVNLDDYDLLVSRNGGSNESEVAFNVGYVLNHTEVYVIAHSGASQEIQNIADQLDNRINFNGDDVIVLRNSTGDHIDVLGRYLEDWNYAEDVTLRRRPLHGPTTTYIPSHFIVYGTDNIDGLGSHQYYP